MFVWEYLKQMQSIYTISSIIVTFLECPAHSRHCIECFVFTVSLNAVSTLGGVAPQVAIVEPVRIAHPSGFGVLPSPASRDTLRNGPKQLIDERAVQSLLIMLIIT